MCSRRRKGIQFCLLVSSTFLNLIMPTKMWSLSLENPYFALQLRLWQHSMQLLGFLHIYDSDCEPLKEAYSSWVQRCSINGIIAWWNDFITTEWHHCVVAWLHDGMMEWQSVCTIEWVRIVVIASGCIRDGGGGSVEKGWTDWRMDRRSDTLMHGRTNSLAYRDAKTWWFKTKVQNISYIVNSL